MVTLEDLRERGLAKERTLCLGGGHGIRAYLPRELQRFSIDLDFYSEVDDLHLIKSDLSNIPGFTERGYGLETDKGFKKYDSELPSQIKKGTIAFTKSYSQAFRSAEIPSEFYVTVSNVAKLRIVKLRQPKSYIGTDYVKAAIPILSPETIMAGKMAIIQIRRIKDLYKDIFDIYAMFNSSDERVDEQELVESLSKTGHEIAESIVRKRFRESSGRENALNAIKLPTESRHEYLQSWKSINTYVRNKTLESLTRAGILSVIPKQ